MFAHETHIYCTLRCDGYIVSVYCTTCQKGDVEKITAP